MKRAHLFAAVCSVYWLADSVHAGLMDRSPVTVRCLINSISRFILLVSCQTQTPMPIQKDYRSMAMVLKHLKTVLDEIVDYEVSSDEILYKECEELDLAVNEAREFMENCYPKMSKICV
ncbi:hypothetical protein GH714_030552 [Hevea brasiliensis]|uniref:PUB2-4-like N-terminal domain-containing protein n=1 Tax=Hevea brasiliensis TaxID=3981 RepID=A0A6A6KEU0_HEVBR|nr:hypothetical protein GH714_030552 [Hevea brasiliensis]